MVMIGDGMMGAMPEMELSAPGVIAILSLPGPFNWLRRWEPKLALNQDWGKVLVIF